MDNINTAERYNVGGVMMPRPFKVNRLGHVGLYVADYDASHHFYSTLLGFHETDKLAGRPGTVDPLVRFYTYNTDHHALVLVHNSVARARDDRYDSGVTVNQISFQVGTLEEVVNAHRMLLSKGANIWRIGRDLPGSNWAVYFLDADRHTVEVFYGMEQVGWNRRSKPLSLFGTQVSAEEPSLPQPAELDEIRMVEAAGGEVDTGFQWNDLEVAEYDVGGVLLPRPFKIVRGGPLSLFVRDIDAATSFYTGTMGLALTEMTSFEGEQIAYLQTGGEHHTIALVPVALRARLGITERTTIVAQGLQVGSYTQLKDAIIFMEKHGCQRVDLPSALYIGIDYAAHFVDPDGHLVQLYFQMERVGWDGQPRPASARTKVFQPWPEILEGSADTYYDRTYQGPIG